MGLVLLLFAGAALAVPPTVSITQPGNNSIFNPGETINFQGTAADDEDGDLTGSIAWTSSIDGAIGNGGSFSITTLSVGTHTITATVIDSELIEVFDTISVRVNSPPQVTITFPSDPSSFGLAVPINFQANATDVEDNDTALSNQIAWSSSLDGPIGSGTSNPVNDLTVGTHTITASVTDSDGAPASDSITVTITNNTPVVTITSPTDGLTTALGANINFQGTATDNEDGDLAGSLAWSSSIDGSIGSGASFSTSALTAGTHTITASVTDSNSNPGSDSITVTITNNTPVVTITSPADGLTTALGASINFQGTATDNEDGDLAGSIAWTSNLDGAIGNGASISVSNLTEGVHTITAAVTDSNSNPGSDSITVTITNNAPVVTITSPTDGLTTALGTNINFQGTATDNEDGDLAGSLAWTSSLDGAIGNGASINVSTLTAGTHTITASVTDSNSNPGSASISVTVTNDAPLVTITSPADGASFASGTSINFQGTATDTEDGNLAASLAWTSSLDGAIGTGASINVDTLSVGTHTITAAVTDSDTNPGSDSISVTIANNAPTVTITAPADGASFASGTLINFQATATDTEDDDATLTAQIAWSSSLDGPLGTGGSINVDTLTLGDHTITASVTDSDDGVGSSSITVSITNNAPVITGQNVIETPEDTPIEILLVTHVLASDTENDPLTLIVQDSPDVPASYTRSGVDGNTITPALDLNGPITVPVIVNDGSEDSGVFNLAVTVTPVNDLPAFGGVQPPGLSTLEDTTLTIVLADLIITDPDNLIPDEITLTLTPPGPADNYTLAGATAITPALNFNGQLNVAATVADLEGSSAPFVIPIDVDPVNDLPVLVAPIDDQQAIEDSPFALDVTGNFSDDDTTDVLSYAVQWSPAKPPNINFANGVFSGTPQEIDSLSPGPIYTVTVSASDTEGSVSDMFDLTINALGRANLNMSIDVAPATASPSEELRWTFTTGNPVGPVAGENVELAGSFIGAGVTVTSQGAVNCMLNVQPAQNRTDFTCDIGGVPVGTTSSIVFSTTTSVATEVIGFGTAAGRQRVPIDPNEDDNYDLRAVGVADSFSTLPVQDLGNSSIRSIAAGDVNGDGALDIVVGTQSSQPVQVFFNDAPREPCNCQRDFLGAPISIPDTGSNKGVALADFDNNGSLDLVVANSGNQDDVVYINDGNGNFAPGATLGTSNANDIAVGDFNNDGNMDIVVAASSPNLVYFGNGNGTFSNATQLGDSDTQSVTVGRFDGNNRADIAFANTGGASTVYTKNSGGGFSLSSQLNIGDAASVAAEDLNGDGIDDLVFGRVTTGPGDVPSNPVLINNGNGAFGAPLAQLGLSPTSEVLIGDINEDMAPDLVFINASGVHQVWLETGGNYTLHSEQILDLDTRTGVLANLGDADAGDPGGVDLAMGGRTNAGVGVWLNDSSGNLGLGDAVAPVLTLNGEASVSIPARSNYVDQGATALDNIDGDISARVVVTNGVNTSVVGNYTVTYNVQDTAGNAAAQITRNVNVAPASGQGGGGGGALSYWLLALLLGAVALRKNNMNKQRTFGALAAVLLLVGAAPADAQEIRYSWLDMSLMAQDVDRDGVQVPVPGQTVEVAGSDGDGIRFRGSVGTWKNLYLFIDYGSTDIGVDAVITNNQGVFLASDEFDFTTVRGGLGVKWSAFRKTDIFAEVSYDSTDFDFGSLAGENFDVGEKDIGGALGFRHLFGDHFEVKVMGRFTTVGDIDLNTMEFDSDTLFSVGFAWELIRGFSIVGDYESGEFSNYALGFRLDLDED